MTTNITEYQPIEAGLAQLRADYAKVVFDVVTPKGMAAAKDARNVIRDCRLKLEDQRKAIKAPALKLCSDIDTEARRIGAEIAAIEEPIQAQIDAENQRVKALEVERINKIAARLDRIFDAPSRMQGKDAEAIQLTLNLLTELVIDESFAEFQPRATLEKDKAIHLLTTMLANRKQFEAEQIELKAQQEIIAQREAEQDARDQARIKEEQASRDRIATQEREAAERIAQQEREAKAKRDSEEQAAQAERDRKAAAERKVREAQEAEQREIERKRREILDGDELLENFVDKYGKIDRYAAVVAVIDVYFGNKK